jgi:hypothetical protein
LQHGLPGVYRYYTIYPEAAASGRVTILASFHRRWAPVPMALRDAGEVHELSEDRRQHLKGQGLDAEYSDARFFTQVGTAYIHGIMDGEAINNDDMNRQKIYLI